MSTPATVHSAIIIGVHAYPATIKVQILDRPAQISIDGLSAGAVREATERVRSALVASGFAVPRKRIIVSIDADGYPLHSTGLDLPIAVGILAASGQLDHDVSDQDIITGELALNGYLRPVRGAVPMALLAAAKSPHKRLIAPQSTSDLRAAAQAALDSDVVYGVRNLRDALAVLADKPGHVDPEPAVPVEHGACSPGCDFSDIRGRTDKVNELIDAVAGGARRILLVGPPGTGKSMIARRLADALPPLTAQERCDIGAIYSAAGLPTSPSLPTRRPFRAPHHTVSVGGMLGSRRYNMRPGELTLAHHGVLFLDEAAEFSRPMLSQVRVSLERGWIPMSRLPCTAQRLPAKPAVTIVAVNSAAHAKRLSDADFAFDVTLHLPELSTDKVLKGERAPSTAELRERIIAGWTKRSEGEGCGG